jgi:hypothetical protein
VALLEVGISASFVLEVFLFVLEIEVLFSDGSDLAFRNLGWQGFSEFEIQEALPGGVWIGLDQIRLRLGFGVVFLIH